MKKANLVSRYLLAATLALGGVTAASATDIADVPMAVKTTAAPNIMFIQDDSGSMQWDIMPDDFVYAYFVYPNPSHLYGSSDYYSYVASFNDGVAFNAVARSPQINKIYYNPAITYQPWRRADNSSFPAASPSCAPHNPADLSKGCRNLTANNTQSAYWCSTACGWARKTFWPAVYFTYNGGGVWSWSSYTKREIRASIPTYTGEGREARTDCTGGTCTYAQEIQNFANWYSYYRSRILAARAGIGRAFAQIGETPRVGFAAINQGPQVVDGVSTQTVVSGVRQFSGSDRTAFFDTLYQRAVPAAGTPLRRALDDVGKYFQRTDNQGPWSKTPGTTDASAHAQCRQSYSILMTDGYWNGASASSPANQNVDGNNGPTITGPALDNGGTPYCQAPATLVGGNCSYQYTPTAPMQDGWSDTLADVAMYYWYRDLRPDLDNKVKPSNIDPAFWQHMVTYTVGLGVTGSIDPNICPPPYTAGGCATLSWPNPTSGSPAKIDDMFHAAINSRGGFFSAADPDTFANALGATLADIIGRSGSAAAVAVANANVTSGDNASYVTSYNSGTWTGDLIAYPIDLTTGIPNTASPLWTTNCASAGSDGCTAQEQLDYKASQNGNNASTVRKIVTYTGTTGTGQGRPFQASGCSPSTSCITSTQQGYLNTPSGTDGASVLSYLRGNRTAEGTSYRTRTHLLGDVINSEPVIVRQPFSSYADSCYSAPVTGKCASSFKTAQASRTRVVLQATNDGMVHVFNAATGAEEWAYIPDTLLSLSRDPSNASTSTLNMLSRLSGYYHRYFIDGTPVVGDVDFSNTEGVIGNPDPDWRTIAVGGLGKGGRGYYALDLTTPTASSEADAAAKVLWEFPNSATNSTLKLNIGYTYGKPVITKTAEYGWVVLLTSGYNNGTGTDNSGGDGHGYLWVLDAKTGNVLNTIDTGVGSTGDPSGLAHIAAWADNADLDNTTTYVYGGDLKGNLWRFDLTDNTSTIVYTARKLAVLKDASGATQPVTTVPELAEVPILGGLTKRFVYVGTGQYLGDSDVATTQTQTIYGIVDDLSTGSDPVISDPTRSSLVAQTLTLDAGGTTRTVTSNSIDFSSKKGWYLDLPVTGERISTDPALALGALFFTSNVPSANACAPGGSSWLNFLDAKTGGLIVGSTEDYSSVSLGDALASRPVLIKLPDGSVKVLVRKSDASTVTTDAPLPSSGGTTQRSSWREITD